MDSNLLKASEVAVRLGLSVRQVYHHVRMGRIPATRMDGGGSGCRCQRQEGLSESELLSSTTCRRNRVGALAIVCEVLTICTAD